MNANQEFPDIASVAQRTQEFRSISYELLINDSTASLAAWPLMRDGDNPKPDVVAPALRLEPEP